MLKCLKRGRWGKECIHSLKLLCNSKVLKSVFKGKKINKSVKIEVYFEKNSNHLQQRNKRPKEDLVLEIFSLIGGNIYCVLRGVLVVVINLNEVIEFYK